MKSFNLKKLRVAILHDILIEKGGAEKDLEVLIKIFPNADIFTTLHKKSLSGLFTAQVKSSFPEYFPAQLRNSTLFKLVTYNYWQSLDLSSYNLVISVSGEFASHAVITRPESLHISYCLTPPRYLWSDYHHFLSLGRGGLLRKLFISHLRSIDYISAQRPDIFIAQSKVVQDRIKTFYGRDAQVIYPPVELHTAFHRSDSAKKDDHKKYYSYVGRLSHEKNLDLLIQVFNESGEKLVIVGDGDQKERLTAMAKNNIEFLGYVEDRKYVAQIISKSQAFIHPAVDEDFGIAPVEALSLGVPVIGFKGGGLHETIIDRKTGVLYEENTIESMRNAITMFSKIRISPKACRLQAKRFSEDEFMRKISHLVSSSLNN